MKRPTITDKMKLDVLRRHGAVVPCSVCRDAVVVDNIEYDHERALVDEGEHDVGNLRPICIGCHAKKSAREHIANAKCKRVFKKHHGLWVKKSKPIRSAGFRKHPTLKQTVGGQVVPRV